MSSNLRKVGEKLERRRRGERRTFKDHGKRAIKKIKNAVETVREKKKQDEQAKVQQPSLIKLRHQLVEADYGDR